jgi:5'-phosphate synthase pdxT subunit
MPIAVGKGLQVGVLALQGSVMEHVQCLQKIPGIDIVQVRKPQQLSGIDGIILPGGESTTMGKLLRELGILEPLRELIQDGLPVWGTCAGMILLARNIVQQNDGYLGLLDVTLRRNAYGAQLDSFSRSAVIRKIASHEIPLIFIRAPYIEQWGPEVDVLLELEGKAVAVEQGNILATSFHPELTEDLSTHRYFIRKIEQRFTKA